jgi:SAM-dependent methyltransferase
LPNYYGKVLAGLVTKFEVSDLRVSQRELSEWLNTSFGRNLMYFESLISDSGICKLPGYRAAQLGISPAHNLLEGLLQAHKFVVAQARDASAACVSDFLSLPLPSNALDVILLHHSLDFSVQPHGVLNEAARVVVPGGHIIVVAFDPYSIFGLAKWLAGLFSNQLVWHHHSIRMARLIDWLKLMGFQIVATNSAGNLDFAVNGADEADLDPLAWLKRQVSARAFYVVVARKQAAPPIASQTLRWPALKVTTMAGLRSINVVGTQKLNRGTAE